MHSEKYQGDSKGIEKERKKKYNYFQKNVPRRLILKEQNNMYITFCQVLNIVMKPKITMSLH